MPSIFDLMKVGGNHSSCGECGGDELRSLIDFVNTDGDFEVTSRRLDSDTRDRGQGTARSRANRIVELMNLVEAVSQDPDPTPVSSVFGRRNDTGVGLGNVSAFSQGPASDDSVVRFGIQPQDTGISSFSLRDNLRSLIRNLG